MTDSTRVHPQCTKLAMSYLRETSYGSAIPNGSITRWFEPNEVVLPEITQNRVDDAETIHGHDFPVNTDLDEVVSQDISIPINFRMSVELTGFLLASAMGGVVTTGSTNYTHTMVAPDLCTVDQYPSTTIVLGYGTDTASYFAVKGVIVNELKIALTTAGILNVTGTFFTDGSLTAQPGFVFPTSQETCNFLKGSMCDFQYGTHGGALTSKKSLLRTFEFGINNNLDLTDGRANIPNAGVYLSRLRTGKREYTLTTKVCGHQGDEFWTAWQNGTVLDAYILIQKDATRLISIRAKAAKIVECKESFDGRDDVLDLTWKFFYHDTESSPITIVVKNQVDNYLASNAPSPSISPSRSGSASPSASTSPSTSVSPSPSA